MLLTEYATKWWFVIPPLLTNVSALPGETWIPEIVSFRSRCTPCLENEMAMARNNICTLYLIIGLYCLQKIKLVDECRRYSKPKQCRFRYTVYSTHVTEKTIFWVHFHVSPSNAETLVRRGEITNDHLVAYSLSNISAKSYRNRLMCVEVIVSNISCRFLRHSVEWLPFVWYQNIRSALFGFATKHAYETDGQTDKQNYDFQDRAR